MLLLDDGEPLFDSRAILDHLDSLVGSDARLLPKAEPDRRSLLPAEAGGSARLVREAMRAAH